MPYIERASGRSTRKSQFVEVWISHLTGNTERKKQVSSLASGLTCDLCLNASALLQVAEELEKEKVYFTHFVSNFITFLLIGLSS